MKHGWMTDAACLDGAISDFVPDEGDAAAAARAKKVCAGCSVAEACLLWGEANPHTRRNGIFGGRSPRERARMRTKV